MAPPETLDWNGLRLDGKTAVLGIIGDPVAQVKAPLPLTRLLQARGINAVLVPLHVEAANVVPLLQTLLAVRNVAGIVVTVPHKQLVADLPLQVLRAAREAQAVNVLRRKGDAWEGDLLDGAGFLAGLVRNGFDVKGRSVGLAGAGGAGNAIAFALAGAGAASIDVCDADVAKRDHLVGRLRALGHTAGAWDAASPRDLVVNATPAGMRPGDPLPIAPSAIRPGHTVADVIMEPHTTPLLTLAEQHGARIVRGRHMMDEQLEAMADFFAEALQ
ncbi:shikimate dehydrogenase [Variovorax boronicumulans]|uniref:shikimate dehydrogenase family protein n=1 Tax=Variovorax boronicumulans TaxID=436515 RepID=UPI0027883474|nr:shikimate dehydrogenase [Variovorax boronicumulans]MDQ0033471.1 shikimate dehydrogenase [Variovorax boronicumulans]